MPLKACAASQADNANRKAFTTHSPLPSTLCFPDRLYLDMLIQGKMIKQIGVQSRATTDEWHRERSVCPPPPQPRGAAGVKKVRDAKEIVVQLQPVHRADPPASRD